MVNKIMSVTPKNNCIIEAIFFNGEVRQYDVKQLVIRFPQFEELMQDSVLFDSVSVDIGGYGISWNEELDLDAETIWENGIPCEISKTKDLNHLLAYYILLTREKKHMTQKELAERTGIYQADISKIERGIGNPSLSTLQRIADGLGMKLEIQFQEKNI